MAKKYTEEENPKKTTPETPVTKLRVNCDRLNLRKGASTSADALYILIRGETLHLLEDRGEWCKVLYPKQNLTGYVMTHLVEVEA